MMRSSQHSFMGDGIRVRADTPCEKRDSHDMCKVFLQLVAIFLYFFHFLTTAIVINPYWLTGREK
jgi:hypothetical protein